LSALRRRIFAVNIDSKAAKARREELKRQKRAPKAARKALQQGKVVTLV